MNITKLVKYLAFAVIFTTAAVNADTHEGGANVGKDAPDFDIKDTKGNAAKLSDFKDKVIVLGWYSKDCPFDKPQKDNMIKLQEMAKEKGAVWLTIISSAPGNSGHFKDVDAANKYMDEKGFKADHVILDESGKIGKMYDAKTTPHMFIIGKDMKVKYNGAIDSDRTVGVTALDSDDHLFRVAMEKVVSGEELAGEAAQNEPYGCSVKY